MSGETEPNGDAAAGRVTTIEADDRSSAESLLRFVGAWVGDDLEERLAEVYATRSAAEF